MAGSTFDTCMKTKCIAGGKGVKAKGVNDTKSMWGGTGVKAKEGEGKGNGVKAKGVMGGNGVKAKGSKGCQGSKDCNVGDGQRREAGERPRGD